jgi:hypothetical protein
MKNKNLSGGLFTAKPTPLTIKETPLSAMIAEYLNSRRVYNDRLNCGRVETKDGNFFYGCKTGTPDRFCIIRGQIIFIEVKMFGEKPTPEQRTKHDELRSHGAVVIVADSFDAFISKLSAIRAALEQSARTINLYD